ncbi:MAG: calcium-binding protein, partial [Pseudomonadota bacterium]
MAVEMPINFTITSAELWRIDNSPLGRSLVDEKVIKKDQGEQFLMIVQTDGINSESDARALDAAGLSLYHIGEQFEVATGGWTISFEEVYVGQGQLAVPVTLSKFYWSDIGNLSAQFAAVKRETNLKSELNFGSGEPLAPYEDILNENGELTPLTGVSGVALRYDYMGVRLAAISNPHYGESDYHRDQVDFFVRFQRDVDSERMLHLWGNEDVTGLDADDFSVQGGKVTGIAKYPGETGVYRVTVTADHAFNSQAREVTFGLADDATIYNAAGNGIVGNPESWSHFNRTAKIDHLEVAGISDPIYDSNAATETVAFNVRFKNEHGFADVRSIDRKDIIVEGGTVTDILKVDNETGLYQVIVTPDPVTSDVAREVTVAVSDTTYIHDRETNFLLGGGGHSSTAKLAPLKVSDFRPADKEAQRVSETVDFFMRFEKNGFADVAGLDVDDFSSMAGEVTAITKVANETGLYKISVAPIDVSIPIPFPMSTSWGLRIELKETATIFDLAGNPLFDTEGHDASTTVYSMRVDPDQSITYLEGSSTRGPLGQVSAYDSVGVTGFEIVSGNDDSFFRIDDAGLVWLTESGAAGIANDFESGFRNLELTVEIRDAVGTTAQGTVTLNLRDDLSDNTVTGRRGDTFYGGDGNDNFIGEFGNETFLGGAGNDTLRAVAGENRLDGGSDNDRLIGADGRDVLVGGTGNDNLSGGDARDELTGGDGNDRLNGDGGNDILTGGAGADLFIFSLNGGMDIITDYEVGVDRILLDGTGHNLIGQTFGPDRV